MSTQPADSGGDIVVSDQDLYDHATSDPAPAPATPEPAAPAEAQQPTPVPQQPGINRDDQGRFAPKPPEQQAATTQQPPPEPPPQQQQRQTEDHRVPVATLLQERERAYRAETELHQMRQAYAQWQQQLAAQQQQQQAPQTIFDNPDDYLMQRVIAPLRQEGQMAIMQRMDGISRAVANREFTKPVVDAALNELAKIRQSPQGEYTFNQIMNDGHPYGALVEWHKQARAQQQIGRDPDAWLRQQQQAWFRNPQVRAAMLKDMQQEQQRARSTNGGSPNVQLPPSLSSMPSSSGRIDDQGDLSNESLYRFATK